MMEILILASIIAPITTSVVQTIKINKRYIRAISTLRTIFLGAGAYFFDAELGIRVWAGGISVLAATDLFE